MITALDHIAIAVPDLQGAIRRFMDDFGLKFEGSGPVAAAKTETAFFTLPPTSIELVHPLNGEGPIATYLEKREAASTTCVLEATIFSKMWRD